MTRVPVFIYCGDAYGANMSDPTGQVLATCIMPTGRREPFVLRSLECFRKQRSPNVELAIIDDDPGPALGARYEDAMVRHLRAPRGLSLGAKRNLACQHARGEVIVHWDDDDWHAPDRLAYQVNALLESGADVCGTSRLLFFEPAADRAFEYVYPPSGKPWVAGGTLCYRKDFWRRNPFPNLNVGEDTHFIWTCRPKRLLVLQRHDFYVATIHPGNTSRKRTADPRYRAYPVSEIRRLMGEDFSLFELPGAPTDARNLQPA